MKSLITLVLPIYQKIYKQKYTLNERTQSVKQYILSEITQWTIKSLKQDEGYFFKPKEFKGDSKSTPFEVRLIKVGPYPKMYELKFGNLNAETDLEKFKWDDNDPYRLQKALFLKTVLESEVVPMLNSGQINDIVFSPYDEDGLGDDRYSYFYNMYTKLGKEKFDLQIVDENTYIITKK